jgi:hypothetical protein
VTLAFHLDDDAQRNIDYERECIEVAAERELHDAEYAPTLLSLRRCPKCGHPGGLVRCPRCHGSSAASVLTTALGGVGVVVSRGAESFDAGRAA